MSLRHLFITTVIITLTAGLSWTPATAQDNGLTVDRADNAPATAAPAETPAATPNDEQMSSGDNAKDEKVQEDPNAPKGPGGQQGKKNWWDGMMPLVLLVGVVVVMMFFSTRSRKKQAAKRNEMLSNMKKGDRVVSIGGIIGTVIEVREDEVVVKTDETNNTRMKFIREAIRSVGPDAKAEAAGEKK